MDQKPVWRGELPMTVIEGAERTRPWVRRAGRRRR